MPCWNIFYRLIVLTVVIIWSNFDLGIQDGHHLPFWISWIFKLYAYDTSKETNFMPQGHFYTICGVIGYDNIQIWPWVRDGYHMPCWIFMDFFIVPMTYTWHMNEIDFSHHTIVCINFFLDVTIRLTLDLGNRDSCHLYWQNLMVSTILFNEYYISQCLFLSKKTW